MPLLDGLFLLRFVVVMMVANRVRSFQEPMHKQNADDVTEDEKIVSYWREDIGLNFFHWRWHSLFPAYWKPKSGERRDRIGEIFPFMHQQILARYDAERLSSGLQRVNGLHHWKGRTVIPGYNASGFTKELSGRHYYSRPKNMMLEEINPSNFLHMEHCYQKIVHDIKKGYLEMKNGTRIQLKVYSDIEIVGGILLGSSLRHVFPRYCEFHGEGHFAFSHMHDVFDDDEDDTGLIAFPRASMRDPLFFAWHKLIEDIFWEFKKLLQPYKLEELLWKTVELLDVSVKGLSKHKINELGTFWQKRNVTLNRGLDFSLRHPVKVCLEHLQHEEFEYKIVVRNDATHPVNGVVRIFLAPQNDETGQRYNMTEQIRLFIEMDKFVAHLTPGKNIVRRHSSNSTVCTDIFRKIAELTLYDGKDTSTEDDDLITYCSCGYPAHLQLPRGKPEGMDFLLFVMVTNAAIDMKDTTYPDCHVAPEYCGMLNDVYPDRRPMGFPFDRPADIRNAYFDELYFKMNNVAYTNVTVIFNNQTIEVTNIV